MRPVRALWLAVLLPLAGLATLAYASGQGAGQRSAAVPQGPAGRCTALLSAGADVSAAVAGAGGGSVICLRPGRYPAVEASGLGKAPPVTIRSAPGKRRAIVEGIYLLDPSGLRFQNLAIRAGVSVTPSADALQFVGNDITGTGGIFMFGDFRIGKRVSNILIKGNYIHDLDYGGHQETGFGYGIEGIGDTRNVRILGNTIKSPASDYVQSASPVRWTVSGNTFLGPSLLGSHEDHQDLWQIFGGGRHIVFSDNVARHTQTQESLLFQTGRFEDVLVENNLFDHDSRGYTCQIYQAQHLIFRRNTIVGSHWGCLFRDASNEAPGGRYRIVHNVFSSTAEGADISTEGEAWAWGTYDYNASSDGSASGAHSVRHWRPRWEPGSSYVPLRLPLSAGYRP
jgi:nitrous oxidase accessory protein NosD